MPQSPELAGGAGFTFEDAVAATYLAALLQEGHAQGIQDRTVCRVALQQRDFGEPLDDVIVDFRSSGGESARLSLQVKRALTISRAKSNHDFRDVIRDSWSTLNKPDFRKGTDRFGAAVGEIASQKSRDLRFLCEIARSSPELAEFEERFKREGNANKALEEIRSDVSALIEGASGAACSSHSTYQFLSHFVLVEFDFMHEGGVNEPLILNQIQTCLAPGYESETPSVWANLRQLARDEAGKSGIFDRRRLIRTLAPKFHLATAVSWRADIRKLKQLTEAWLTDIENDVGGVCVDRPALLKELEAARSKSRVVQIRGLPGSGKSALIRQSIEAELEKGPVLFLKSGRLEGTSWQSFAHANGLSGGPLIDFLCEIAATGSSTLYIDGIDRVEKPFQSLIRDVVSAVLTSPALDTWRVVVSLRDTGIEPLRNWMGSLLVPAGLATVEVKSLSDDEAKQLVENKPHLSSLLFGPQAVREMVRRPFFAKVLEQNFGNFNSDTTFQPRSEIDLIENWWNRGGFDADGQAAIDRQRAIIELGELRARFLDQEISIRRLSPPTLALLNQLLEDGIIQDVRRGHTIRFAHDIFFEWAFLRVLVDRGADWLEEIRSCGEPPTVARAVELLSQAEISQDKTWSSILKRIERSGMRSQWTRAWLLAPLSLPNFADVEATFAEVVSHENWHLLKKALVWFQAEKTTPNPNILGADLPQDLRIRIADHLGWPSDFRACRRFIHFILTRESAIPKPLCPHILSVFEVWQNAFAGIRNHTSDKILECVAHWLIEIERNLAREATESSSAWDVLGADIDSFRESLATMVLRGALARPDLAEQYLQQIINLDRITEKRFSEVIKFSPVLAQCCPSLVVELTLKHLRDELPEDRLAREQEASQRLARRRDELLAKPDGSLSDADQKFLEVSGPPRFVRSISSHDWESLSLTRGGTEFWPPSPLREPFRSLFEKAPDLGFRLLTELSNHAMAAWRQLFRLSYEDRGTPIPLDIDFPWGTQRFWGGEREYLWSRGAWAPQPLASAYMALEKWALLELQRGHPVDDLIQRLVRDNNCIAALGTAVTVALQAQALSEAIFPLVTCQRLLCADIGRHHHDKFNNSASLIGFHGEADSEHAEAVRSANLLPVRDRQLSNLLVLYFLTTGGGFSERAKFLVEQFKDRLPFQTEEEKDDAAACDAYLDDARKFEELVQWENYRTEVLPDDNERVAIIHSSPSANTPEKQHKLAVARQEIAERNLLAWADSYFENGELSAGFTIATAVDLAKAMEAATLNTPREDESLNGVRRGAVAATAALLLCVRRGVSEVDMQWARGLLQRIICSSETAGEYWVPESIIPWHHGIFVARGLAADLRLGTAQKGAAELLLALVAHPLDTVSLAAVEQALSVWDVSPRLGWATLNNALSNCHESMGERFKSGDVLYTARERKVLFIAAARQLQGEPSWIDLPLPPPAWVKVAKGAAGSQDFDVDPFDESERIDPRENWAEPKVYWRSKYAAKVLSLVPTNELLASGARAAFLRFTSEILKWTMQKVAPPWIKKGARDRSAVHLYEWINELGRVLGAISNDLPIEYVRSDFLKPIFDLDDERCWHLLRPFVDGITFALVSNTPSKECVAPDILRLVLDRVLQEASFQPKSYRSGSLYGMDLPHLADALMLLSAVRSVEATKEVTDQWSRIEHILPVVDKFVRVAGWSREIMGRYLSLCEHFRSEYPADQFADQVLSVIEARENPLQGWRGTLLCARIAGLVQHFSDRETPMPQSLGQRFLRILDVLVDMGDRRSAALQLSEWFREVKAVQHEPAQDEHTC